MIALHKLKSPNDPVEVDSDAIRDMRWASSCGGTLLDMVDGSVVEVDENPNSIGLTAGWLKEPQCALGSRSGKRYPMEGK